MNYNSLKNEIEKTCLIASWNPSQEQIGIIISEIAHKKPASVNEAAGIVASVCPDTIFISMEGVDESDVRTLLALAIQASKVKK